MADYGGARGCQCSVEDCPTVLELFLFDLSGDALTELRTFERGVSQFDMSSGERRCPTTCASGW